jgi:AsmA protein
MPRILKISAIVVGAVLAVVAAALAIIALTFNPNEHKDAVIKLVHDKTGRTLAIPGQVKLTFYPRLGADLGQLTLSERNSNAPFLGVEHARVSLALMPLLAKKMVVDRVDVEGLSANIVRAADGSLSTDDLTGKPKEEHKEDSGGANKLVLAVDSIDVVNAALHVIDRKEGRSIDITHLMLHTGPIGNKTASDVSLTADIALSKPQLATSISIKSGFTLDLDGKHLALNKLDASVHGAAGGTEKLSFGASGNVDLNLASGDIASDGMQLSAVTQKATQSMDARLELPSFKSTSKQLKLPKLALKLALKDAGLDAKLNMTGTLAADLDAMRISGSDFKLGVEGSKAGKALAGQFDAAFMFDVAKQVVNATLKGKLDASTIEARLGMQGFATPAVDFAVTIDQIDLDRYRAVPAAGAASTPAPAASAGATAADAPVDLSALHGLNAKGSIKIGAVQVSGLHLSALGTELHAGGQRVALSPISAKLYGGGMNGALNLDYSASSSAPNIALDANLSGIALGSLLKDLLHKTPIEGRGDVQLAVSTHGASVTQLRRALGGTARIKLVDGAVSGFNLAQIVRDAKAKFDVLKGSGSARTGTASSTDKTDFTEMTASLRIAAGVAHNDDLSAKTPLFRLGGAGDVDLGRESLDYQLKCTIVPSLQGQGGPELQALKGVTVPVRLSGPFTAIGWHLDFQAMVGDTVKQKVQDKVKDALKGLLGR